MRVIGDCFSLGRFEAEQDNLFFRYGILQNLFVTLSFGPDLREPQTQLSLPLGGPMLTIAICFLGVLACLSVGDATGLWLFEPNIGLIWATLVCGYVFEFLRLWLASPSNG